MVEDKVKQEIQPFHYEHEESDLQGGEDISQGEELMHQKKDDNQQQGRFGVPPAYFGP